MAVDIVSLIRNEVAYLDIGFGHPPLFDYGPDTQQNKVADRMNAENAIVFLHFPIISKDDPKTSGAYGETYEIVLFFGMKILSKEWYDYNKQRETTLLMRALRLQLYNRLNALINTTLHSITDIRTIEVLNKYDKNLTGVTYDFNLTVIGGDSVCLPESPDVSDVAEIVSPVVAVPGCTNPAAPEYDEEATVDDGSCTIPGTGELVFGAAVDNESFIGANIFESDLPNLEDYAPFAEELEFDAMYYTPSTPAMGAGNAAILNTFLAGARLWHYYPTRSSSVWAARWAYLDWLIATFPTLDGILHDQESQSGPGTLTHADYVTRTQLGIAHSPALLHSWDTPPIEKSNPAGPSRLRLEAIKPWSDTNLGKVYRQVADAIGPYSPTDHLYNLAQWNNYLNTILPDRETDFFDLMTNITKQIDFQMHLNDAGDQELSEPLANWAIGEITRHTLSSTKYKGVFFMKFANLITGGVRQPLFYAMKRTNQCYKFAKSIPITIPFSGVKGRGFSDGADSFAVLLDNETSLEHTLTTSDIVITGKTVSGDFNIDRGWAAAWGDPATNEEITAPTIVIKPHCSLVARFGTYVAEPAPDYVTVICSTYTKTDYEYAPGMWVTFYKETCNVNTDRPVFLGFHPGGATRENYKAYPKDMASRGYLGGTADYSAGFLESAIDIWCLTRWVRANAVMLGINPDNIFWGGTSLGGGALLQASLASLDINNAAFAGASNFALNLLNPGFSSAPSGTFTQSGAATGLYTGFIGPTNVKNLFKHGESDTTVPYSQALANYNDMIAAGALPTFVKYPSPVAHDLNPYHSEMLLGGHLLLDGVTVDPGIIQDFKDLMI